MSHLKPIEQQKLAELLNKYPCLFKGGLGTLNIPLVKSKSGPWRNWKNRTMREPFQSPTATKKQHTRRWNEKIRVSKGANDSEWSVAANLCGSKENSDVHVRILTDFRELNKVMKWKPYLLPKYPTFYKNSKGLNVQQLST